MRVFALAGLLVLVPGCGSALGDHQALWAAKGPASYHYTYGTSGFVPHVELVVTVRSGVITSTTVISPADFPGAPRGPTVEQLFEDIRQRLAGPCRTTARYDETIGYPLSTYSDCGEEGDGWAVRDLAADSTPDGGAP